MSLLVRRLFEDMYLLGMDLPGVVGGGGGGGVVGGGGAGVGHG